MLSGLGNGFNKPIVFSGCLGFQSAILELLGLLFSFFLVFGGVGSVSTFFSGYKHLFFFSGKSNSRQLFSSGAQGGGFSSVSQNALVIEIQRGNSENDKLVKDINELKTTLLAAMSP